MKKVYSFVLIFLVIFFWIFRIIVCLNYAMQKEFLCVPYNYKIELIILFITILAMIGIIRRHIVGAISYFFMYVAYFGTSVYEIILNMSQPVTFNQLWLNNNVLFGGIGIILPSLVLIDIIIEMNGTKFEDSKSVWYYNDKKYDRKLDERADINQYRKY